MNATAITVINKRTETVAIRANPLAKMNIFCTFMIITL